MKNVFGIAIRTTLVTLVVTGLIYPFVMTGVAQVLFPWRANGSLVTDDKGQVVGSDLIAQGFANPAYLQPRPSAAGEKGYDAANSSGSNLGPTSKKLQDRIKEDIKRLKEENPDASSPVPADLVTASGSGLDPDVSPQGALWQVPRIAKTRGISHSRRAQGQCAFGQSRARSSVWPPRSAAGSRGKGYSKRQRCERGSISRAVGSSVNLLPRKVLYRLILKSCFEAYWRT